MDQTTFNEDIMMSLASGLVDVEFDAIGVDGDKLLDFAFRRARDVYIQKGADDWKQTDLAIDVVAGQKTYDLPTDGGKVSTIVRIIKPTAGFSVEDPHSLAAFNSVFGGSYGKTGMGGCDYVDLTLYQLSMQRLEEIRKFTAYEEDFHHDQIANKIIFTRAPSASETWFAECYRQMSDDEYRDVLWVKEYAESEAKKILGTAYRKLSGSVTGPNGAITLSGDEMIREAKEKQDQLIEDIANYVDGDIQFSGIYIG